MLKQKSFILLGLLFFSSISHANAFWPSSAIRLVGHDRIVVSVAQNEEVFTLGEEGRIVAWNANGFPRAWTFLEGAEAIALSEIGLNAFTSTEHITYSLEDFTIIEREEIEGHCLADLNRRSARVWFWQDPNEIQLLGLGDHFSFLSEIPPTNHVFCSHTQLSWLASDAHLVSATISGDFEHFSRSWSWFSDPHPIFYGGLDGWIARENGIRLFVPANGETSESLIFQSEETVFFDEPLVHELSSPLRPLFVDLNESGITVADLHGWFHVSSEEVVTRRSDIGWQILGVGNGLVAVCQEDGFLRVFEASGAVIWNEQVEVSCAEIRSFSADGETTFSVGGRSIDLRRSADWIEFSANTVYVTPMRGLHQKRWRVEHSYAASCAGIETRLFSEYGSQVEEIDAVCGSFSAIPVVLSDGQWTGIGLAREEDNQVLIYSLLHLEEAIVVSYEEELPSRIVYSEDRFQVDDVVDRVNNIRFTNSGRVLSATDIRENETLFHLIDLGESLIIERETMVWAERTAFIEAVWLNEQLEVFLLTPEFVGVFWGTGF